jgi:hypothetical protein
VNFAKLPKPARALIYRNGGDAAEISQVMARSIALILAIIIVIVVAIFLWGGLSRWALLPS